MVYVILGILFLLTALLTAAEMATFSARPERMRQLAAKGDRKGTLVLAYQRSPVSFLSAGQVLATAAAFATGAIIQADLTPHAVRWLDSFLDWTPAQLEGTGATLMLIVVTIVALILTNVVPKQIGFDHADRVAVFFAPVFRFLIRLTRPIAWLVTVSGQVFERVVNRRNRLGARVTEGDLLTLLAEGIRIGALDPNEAHFVRKALRLSDLTMRDVMTPIAQVEAIDLFWNPERVDDYVRATNHSFYPVYEGALDCPIGVLKAREWMTPEGAKPKLKDILMPIAVLKDSDSAVTLFETLKDEETRILFVQDKAGQTVGMVTLNDAIVLLTGPLDSLDV